jgi:hypothetical protein
MRHYHARTHIKLGAMTRLREHIPNEGSTDVGGAYRRRGVLDSIVGELSTLTADKVG